MLSTEHIEITYFDFGKLYWEVCAGCEHRKSGDGQYEPRTYQYDVSEFSKLSIPITGPINHPVIQFAACVIETARYFASSPKHKTTFFQFSFHPH